MSRIEVAVRCGLSYVDAFNHHDLPALLRLVSEDCVLESAEPAPGGTAYRGKAALAEYWQGLFAASPRLSLKVEEIHGLGLRCILRRRYEWLDAGGTASHGRGVDIIQVSDGLICALYSYTKGKDAG